MTALDLPARPRILVVALRRLGDVLLTTPLIGSLRRALPDAVIDVLVFADTAGILDGNPDVNVVIAMPPKPTIAESFALTRRLWRRYDLAISTQCGDRPTFFTFAAGRTRIGPVESRPRGMLKSFLFHRVVKEAPACHRVEQVLRFADTLEIDRVQRVGVPRRTRDVPNIDCDYAVIHAAPMFRYKQWTRDGWRQLATALAARGLIIIASGGPLTAERDYLDEVWQPLGSLIERYDGRMDWPGLAALLAGARIYIGPDTSVTHLAAASGCPTVALFGPTDPTLWGPWPSEGLAEPWQRSGTIQNRGNVWLVQNPLSCLPCQREGCERHLKSYSRCLDELTVNQVLMAADRALAFGEKASVTAAAPGGAVTQTPVMKAAYPPVRS